MAWGIGDGDFVAWWMGVCGLRDRRWRVGGLGDRRWRVGGLGDRRWRVGVLRDRGDGDFVA